jgi:hypothetical protein
LVNHESTFSDALGSFDRRGHDDKISEYLVGRVRTREKNESSVELDELRASR